MLLRVLPIVLAGAVFTAATCVTSFEAQSPSGPWTGEFRNYGAYEANNFEWQVVDANGVPAPQTSMNICPHSIPAGGTGAFEMSVVGEPRPFAALPPSIQGYGGFDLSHQQSQLTASVAGWTGTQTAKVVNEADNLIFSDIIVCAVSRTQSGEVLAVSPEVRLPDQLLPGERAEVELQVSRYAGFVDAYVTGAPVVLERTNPDGSVVIDTGPFDVTLPEGWSYTPHQGFDSFVGEFTSGETSIVFDYGWYNGLLDEFEDDPTYAVSHETIDGRDALIVTPLGSAAGVTAAHIIVDDDVLNTIMQTTILLYSESVPQSLRSEVLSIYRSLKFEDEWQ